MNNNSNYWKKKKKSNSILLINRMIIAIHRNDEAVFSLSFSPRLSHTHTYEKQWNTRYSTFVCLKWSATVCPFVYMSALCTINIHKDSNSTGRWFTSLPPYSSRTIHVLPKSDKSQHRNEATIHLDFFSLFFIFVANIIHASIILCDTFV